MAFTFDNLHYMQFPAYMKKCDKEQLNLFFLCPDRTSDNRAQLSLTTIKTNKPPETEALDNNLSYLHHVDIINRQLIHGNICQTSFIGEPAYNDFQEGMLTNFTPKDTLVHKSLGSPNSPLCEKAILNFIGDTFNHEHIKYLWSISWRFKFRCMHLLQKLSYQYVKCLEEYNLRSNLQLRLCMRNRNELFLCEANNNNSMTRVLSKLIPINIISNRKEFLNYHILIPADNILELHKVKEEIQNLQRQLKLLEMEILSRKNVTDKELNRPDDEIPRICAICTEPIEDEEVILECLHAFHRKDIARWYTTSPTCPYCRHPISEWVFLQFQIT